MSKVTSVDRDENGVWTIDFDDGSRTQASADVKITLEVGDEVDFRTYLERLAHTQRDALEERRQGLLAELADLGVSEEAAHNCPLCGEGYGSPLIGEWLYLLKLERGAADTGVDPNSSEAP